MSIATYTREVIPDMMNGRPYVPKSSGTGGGGISGGGLGGGSYANLLTENTFNKLQIFAGGLTSSGVVTFNSTLSVVGAVSLSSNATIGGTLGVTGISTFTTYPYFNAGARFGSTSAYLLVDYNASALRINGAANITGNTTIGGTLGVTGTLGVSGVATFYGNVSVAGNLSVVGSIDRYNQTELNIGDTFINLGTAQVTAIDGGIRIYSASGATLLSTLKYVAASDNWNIDKGLTLSSTLSITGNTTIGGTLGVTGIATFTTYPYLNAGTRFGSTSAYIAVTYDSGNTRLSVAGAAYISGAATLSSTLAVTGAATLSSTLGVTGNTTVGGTLGVTGVATFTTYPYFNAGARFGSTSAYIAVSYDSGNTRLNIAGAAYISGVSTFNSTINQLGSMYSSASIGTVVFAPGFTGEGWQIDALGNLYVKSLEVRETFRVFSMEVEKMAVNEGSHLYTQGVEIVAIDTNAFYYDASNRNYAVFTSGQILRCQQWSGSTEVKYYQIQVVTDVAGTGDYATARKVTYTSKSGAGTVAIGDTVARVSGDVLELTSRGGGYIQIANGITTTAGSWTPKFRVGYVDGLSSTAKSTNATGYGMWSDKFVVDSSGAYLAGTINAYSGAIGQTYKWIFDTDGNLYNGYKFGDGAGVQLNATSKWVGVHQDGDNFARLFYVTSGQWGIKGMIDGNLLFQLGSTNKIANWVFDTTSLYNGYKLGAGLGVEINGTSKYISVASATNSYIKMYSTSTSDWGVIGIKSGTTYFQLGSTNTIAAFTFDSSSIYSGNKLGAGVGLEINSSSRYFSVAGATNSYIKMYETSSSDWGIIGVNAGTTYFQLGSTNKIANMTFDDYHLYSDYISIQDYVTGKSTSSELRIGTSSSYSLIQYFGGAPGIYINDDDYNDSGYNGHLNISADGLSGYYNGTQFYSISFNEYIFSKGTASSIFFAIVGLPTSSSGLITGQLYTQTATQLGGSGTTKVICIV